MIIHNPCNEYTKRYRNYNLFWDELTNALKNKYTVTENRSFEKAHQGVMITISGKEIRILDCEYIIEYEDSIYVMSISDDLNACILQDNPKIKKVLVSQFIDYKMKHHVQNINLYSPWIYFQQTCIDLEPYVSKEGYKIPKLYFRGTKSYRPILNHFDTFILYCPDYTVTQEEYLKEIVQYKVALSIAGTGEICYRDIECMILGIPFLRFQYQSSLYEPLIPNYHYISVDYDKTIPQHNGVHTDRLGEKVHAKQLEKRFIEVVKDENFLKFIAKNARDYYDTYLSPSVRVNKTLELLGI